MQNVWDKNIPNVKTSSEKMQHFCIYRNAKMLFLQSYFIAFIGVVSSPPVTILNHEFSKLSSFLRFVIAWEIQFTGIDPQS